MYFVEKICRKLKTANRIHPCLAIFTNLLPITKNLVSSSKLHRILYFYGILRQFLSTHSNYAVKSTSCLLLKTISNAALYDKCPLFCNFSFVSTWGFIPAALGKSYFASSEIAFRRRTSELNILLVIICFVLSTFQVLGMLLFLIMIPWMQLENLQPKISGNCINYVIVSNHHLNSSVTLS